MNVKKAVSTQVDHISLIISRNPLDYNLKDKEFFEIEQSVMKKNKKRKTKIEYDVEQQVKQEEQQQQIQQQSQLNNEQPAGDIELTPKTESRKYRRRRLDSAPAYDTQSSDYYDDVNYTLSGYLHLHTVTSLRQYIANHQRMRVTNPLPVITSRVATDASQTIAAPSVSAKAKSDEQSNKNNKAAPFSNLFVQPSPPASNSALTDSTTKTNKSDESAANGNDMNNKLNDAEKPLLENNESGAKVIL